LVQHLSDHPRELVCLGLDDLLDVLAVAVRMSTEQLSARAARKQARKGERNSEYCDLGRG
jgi:hypothetical protein